MTTPRGTGPNPFLSSAPSTAQRGARMPTDRSIPQLPPTFAVSTPSAAAPRPLATLSVLAGPGNDENDLAVGLGISTSRAVASSSRAGPRDAPLIDLDFGAPALSAPEQTKAVQELERRLRESRRESLELKARLAAELGGLTRDGEHYRAELQKAEDRVAKLTEDRDFLHNANQALTSQLAELRTAHEALRKSTDATVSKLRQDNTTLQDRLSDAQSKLSAQTADSRRKESEWSATKARLEAQLAGLGQQAARSGELAQSRTQEGAELHDRIARLEKELRDERMRTSRAEDADIIARQLTEQQAYIATLKTKVSELTVENAAVKARLENVEILKSERDALQQDLDRTADVKRRNEELERELALARAERTQWASFLPSGEPGTPAGSTTPAAVAKRAYRTQLDLAIERERAGELAAKHAALEVDFADASAKLGKALDRVGELEAAVARLESRAARAERGKALAAREIDLYKARCESYEIELGEMKPGSGKAPDGMAEGKRWEEVADGYKARVAELETELAKKDSAGPGAKSDAVSFSAEQIRNYQARIRELEEQAAQTKADREMLEKQCSALDEQVGLLERALGRGEYNPDTTKILELRDNPYAQSQAIRQDQLDKLTAENTALLQRLSSPSSKDAVVPVASVERVQAELQRAQTELGEWTKRLDRLKKVFHEQAGVVRDTVFKVLGYKLDADPASQRITLRSSTSQQDSHCFYFQSSPSNPSEHLKFLGSGSSDFLASLDPAVQYYVTSGKSIPALLAWVTLDGFRRTAGVPSMLPPGGDAGGDADEEQRKRRRM
ncbi:spindle assembly checkpoint component Mad1 [Hyaloraphidium curvatum]|nr:spindle assembly checkpoint component Mad1 [Hyaloraphidium curvatum]